MLPAGSQFTSMLEKAILVPLKALLFEMDAQSNSFLWECGAQFGPPWNASKTYPVLPPFDSLIFRAQTYQLWAPETMGHGGHGRTSNKGWVFSMVVSCC
jgi:hypothetical protein